MGKFVDNPLANFCDHVDILATRLSDEWLLVRSRYDGAMYWVDPDYVIGE